MAQTKSNYCANSAFYDSFDCNQYLDTSAIYDDLTEANGLKYFSLAGFDSDLYRLPTPSSEIDKECFGIGT